MGGDSYGNCPNGRGLTCITTEVEEAVCFIVFRDMADAFVFFACLVDSVILIAMTIYFVSFLPRLNFVN